MKTQKIEIEVRIPEHEIGDVVEFYHGLGGRIRGEVVGLSDASGKWAWTAKGGLSVRTDWSAGYAIKCLSGSADGDGATLEGIVLTFPLGIVEDGQFPESVG